MSTRQPISSVILSASTSSVSFTNIPQTYTDLYLVVSGNSAGGYINTRIRFNNDVGSSYSFTRLGVTFPGNNPTLSAGSEQNATFIRGAQMDNADNQFFTVNIMSYTNTNINKTVLVKTYNSDGGGYGDSPTVVTGLWRNTGAISSIIITTDGTSFASNTTFDLYGIDSSLSAQAKATGGSSIYRDGSYWYHIFNTSGTFIPTESLTADFLVVAGGGGSNADSPGGGGAGGLRSTVTATGGGGSLESALSLTAQAYTVTVGAGGAYASNGSNSVFSTITSVGGGRSGGNATGTTYEGATGGSGGGGSGGGTPNTGGAGTANQGFAGGTGRVLSPYTGGGGGGAGAVGADGNSGGGGAGGNGVAVSITGSSVTYAGGGGGNGGLGSGASGGSGGGGQGGDSANPSAAANGTANTGGGAGGGNNANQRTGGSGVVVIRYAV